MKQAEKNYTLKMEVEGDKLVLQSRSRTNTNWKNGLSISFEVAVPRLTSNDLTTSGGNIVLIGVEGKQDFTTSGGHLRLSLVEAEKYVKLSNSGSNIDLELPAGKGYDLGTRGSKIKTEALGNYSGSMSESRLNGKLNGGGIAVTMDRGERINLSFHK